MPADRLLVRRPRQRRRASRDTQGSTSPSRTLWRRSARGWPSSSGRHRRRAYDHGDVRASRTAAHHARLPVKAASSRAALSQLVRALSWRNALMGPIQGGLRPPGAMCRRVRCRPPLLPTIVPSGVPAGCGAETQLHHAAAAHAESTPWVTAVRRSRREGAQGRPPSVRNGRDGEGSAPPTEHDLGPERLRPWKTIDQITRLPTLFDIRDPELPIEAVSLMSLLVLSGSSSLDAAPQGKSARSYRLPLHWIFL
jgi:hypothetical protein